MNYLSMSTIHNLYRKKHLQFLKTSLNQTTHTRIVSKFFWKLNLKYNLSLIGINSIYFCF